MNERETILARRALFMASALSGLVSSRAIAAEPEPRCLPPAAPSAEQVATARELFRIGTGLGESGDFEQALEHLERAYALVQNPRLLVTIAQIARSSGDWARAFTRAEQALACESELRSSRAVALEIVEQARLRVARLSVDTNPDGAALELDGLPIGRTPLDQPVVINAGHHTLTARWPSGQVATTELTAAEADEQTITLVPALVDDCLHEPCVCLQPCLSPPPLETQRRSRLGAALGYTSFVDLVADQHAGTGHGLAARAFYELPLGESARLELGLAVTPALIPDGTLIPIGGTVALLFRPAPFVVGPMLSAGYVFADDDGSPTDRSVARSSIFANPELVLGFEPSEQVVIGAHIGPFWSLQARHDDRSIGAGWLSSGVFLSYAFGRACHEKGYPVRCTEPPDEVASY